MMGIYKISNNINKKFYIGSAVNIKRRIDFHLSRLNNNSHYNIHLQRAWNKYGKENFVFEILEIVNDKLNLLKREQFYLDELLLANEYIHNENHFFTENGYNINPCAYNTLGRKTSDETKTKISKSLIGKLVGDKNPNFGNKMPNDSRERLSQFRKTCGKKIRCLNNNKIYHNSKRAAEDLGISNGSIKRILRGEYKQVKGFTFEYV
jgi:group I intron endonuclease